MQWYPDHVDTEIAWIPQVSGSNTQCRAAGREGKRSLTCSSADRSETMTLPGDVVRPLIADAYWYIFPSLQPMGCAL